MKRGEKKSIVIAAFRNDNRPVTSRELAAQLGPEYSTSYVQAVLHDQTMKVYAMVDPTPGPYGARRYYPLDESTRYQLMNPVVDEALAAYTDDED